MMLSVGIAMDENFRAQIESMGQLTIIDVSDFTNSSELDLDEEGIGIISAIPGVERVIPERKIYAYLQYGKSRTVWSVNLVGLSAE
ncbi:MAG: hypothetical protein ATN35_10430 [Epulopiscium sp. Nele67-Bin004]|nr:MAG: hypothetical protein ATN35_10430 [Epulopiscium sp. Nele67-Bin004]